MRGREEDEEVPSIAVPLLAMRRRDFCGEGSRRSGPDDMA